jgi:4-hydroxybenzoate polyprenyltransferase
VVVPIISGEFMKWTTFQYLQLFFGIASFIILASAIYFLNDIHDINLDRAHPSKSNRPIPSGKITKPTALIWTTIYLITALSIGRLVDQQLFNLQVIYLAISVSYIYVTKLIPYWEMISISTGFIIRSAAGAVFVNTKPSYFFYSIILQNSCLDCIPFGSISYNTWFKVSINPVPMKTTSFDDAVHCIDSLTD